MATTVVVAASIGVGPAAASREPRLTERAAIVEALPRWLRDAPVECVWLRISVAISGRYALVAPTFMNVASRPRCASIASNGFFILRKHNASWRVIYRGSDPQPCALRVPRDLVACSR